MSAESLLSTMQTGFQSTTESKSMPIAQLSLAHQSQRRCLHLAVVPCIALKAPCLCSKDGRPEIFLKREDLNHTGAHKINNSLGQALLCQRMGKKRVIAETGAGQHGVATVSILRLSGLPASERPCNLPLC